MALPAIKEPAREAFSLARYDAMCRAIDAAFEVDEAKEIRDQALAFEVYSRQAKNIDAERRACNVRLRAESKAGEILAQLEKAKGGQPYQTGSTHATDVAVDRPATLAELGISPRQSSDWQRLAKVPREQFEAALADPTQKPTTAGIIAAATPPKPDIVPVAADALWLWGRLTDFERDLLAKNTHGDALKAWWNGEHPEAPL